MLTLVDVLIETKDGWLADPELVRCERTDAALKRYAAPPRRHLHTRDLGRGCPSSLQLLYTDDGACRPCAPAGI